MWCGSKPKAKGVITKQCGLRRAARVQTSTASLRSTSSGRCGPCCSIEAKGIRITASARAASRTCGDVRRSQRICRSAVPAISAPGLGRVEEARLLDDRARVPALAERAPAVLGPDVEPVELALLAGEAGPGDDQTRDRRGRDVGDFDPNA